MASLGTVFPILPGKVEAFKTFGQEIFVKHAQEHAASRQRLGITRECSYHQATPMGDFAIVYLEAQDVNGAFMGLATSQEPFDVWFRQRVQEIHGVDLSAPPAGPAPEVNSEWEAA